MSLRIAPLRPSLNRCRAPYVTMLGHIVAYGRSRPFWISPCFVLHGQQLSRRARSRDCNLVRSPAISMSETASYLNKTVTCISTKPPARECLKELCAPAVVVGVSFPYQILPWGSAPVGGCLAGWCLRFTIYNLQVVLSGF